MIPPTSIDGTDITGATIDGTDVQEITVDGDVVFSAAPDLPVAYSNLIAWYPFDSAEYGGSNTDDVTSILSGSGDSTNYSLSPENTAPTYSSSGGVNDINAGANSGAFDFDGTNQGFDTGLDSAGNFSTRTVTCWFNTPNFSNTHAPIGTDNTGFDWAIFLGNNTIGAFTGSGTISDTFNYANNFHFVAGIWEPGVRTELYVDGGTTPFASSSTCTTENADSWRIGRTGPGSSRFLDGIVDDVRIYDTALTGSQIDQIYQNTQP